MVFFTGGAPRRDERYLSEYTAPLGSVLRAQAAEVWKFSPTSSIARSNSLLEARGRQALDEPMGPGRYFREMERELQPEPELSPMMTAESARQKLQDNGVEDFLTVPEEGIRSDALDILIDRKRDERALQSVLDRSPSGFGAGALRLGTGLAVSMLDPINVAAAFIPVAGQARYAAAIKNAASTIGRAGVRARYGAIEGTVGAAAVEPIVYGAAQLEQSDYGTMDALANIAFGTVLGGGLHMGAGAVADATRSIRRRRQPTETVTPEEEAGEIAEALEQRGRQRTPLEAEIDRAAREVLLPITQPQGPNAARIAALPQNARRDLLSIAVSQAARGKNIDVDAAVNMAEAIEAVRPSTLASARRQAQTELTQQMRDQLEAEAAPRMSRGARQELEAEVRRIDHELGNATQGFRERVRQLQRDQGLKRREAERAVRQSEQEVTAELQSRKDAVQAQLQADDVARGAKSDLSRLEQGIVPQRFQETVEERARAMLTAGKQTPIAEGIARMRERRPDIDLDARWRDVRAAATRNGSPESSVGHDATKMQRIREELAEQQARSPETPEQAKAETDELLTELRDMQTRMGSEFIDETELQRLDADIQAAQDFGIGMRALGACQLRRGAA